ncbi:helix-turn-helix transcriptional regulator [Desulfosporosinus sp. BICA1-9]|uniref:helix-turn-helix transcriptional regulator n=1 Tax=Desulfosporosinus sp. BICA1-9 TaxID=1531958 RepID=UPI00054BC745|nr:helix-turn-helix transcriptional regulator [Desulfosporosinus sp. BICA1-9]KJS47897.1 MAG: Cro/Cl family transcriptional regulator [Peptococcaceae bacterium BRH_c23]KJS82629.1 MAG: Cro/Cl family transcriptional regulator [Desulfosporosinus sp. BICA1-9]HBW37772.1 XRE family transcriptional regulator [Desulfosporosinus sp.]
MDTRQAIANRIVVLCKERNITPNALSYRAAVPQSTIKSILNDESLNPGIVTIKKLCDGLEISLPDFFNTDVFRNLEQELN